MIDGPRYIVLNRMAKQRRASMPWWRGWQAVSYGPNARHRIARMPPLYWHIMGRSFFKAMRPLAARPLTAQQETER